MKSYTLDNLKQFGFTYVTAESDGLSYRTLFGVTQEGWELLEHYFGLHHGSIPHPFLTDQYSSILLAHDVLPGLLIFCVFYTTEYKDAMWIPTQDNQGLGIREYLAVMESDDDKQWKARRNWLQENHWQFRIFSKSGDAVNGTRYRHYFTGMTE